MWIVGLVVFTVMGILGVAAVVSVHQPQLNGPIATLESVAGWLGLVGLAWAVLGLLQWISALGALAAAPVTMGIAIVSNLALLALSLILAAGLLASFLGENQAGAGLAKLTERLTPFKVVLGGVCLASAAYSLVRIVI
jgi:hypothetical protein